MGVFLILPLTNSHFSVILLPSNICSKRGVHVHNHGFAGIRGVYMAARMWPFYRRSINRGTSMAHKLWERGELSVVLRRV